MDTRKKKGFKALAIGILLGIALIMVTGNGCTRTVETGSKKQQRDSVVFVYVHDTVRMVILDSTRYEMQRTHGIELESRVTFAADGGTYNAQTGEMTGVTEMETRRLQHIEEEMRRQIWEYAEMMEAQNDSLRHLVSTMQEQDSLKQNTADITPSKTKTYYWLGSLIGLICGVALSVAVWFLLKNFYKVLKFWL